MKRFYEAWNPGAAAQEMIYAADQICQTYRASGYDLTLRQLYYQFVAQALIPNNLRSYKRLGDIVNRARMAGLLDWDYIVDRTRNLRGTSHWSDPSSVIESAAHSYRRDKWADQPVRVELWVEKEALAGVIERTAAELDLDWFACRGYVSQSEQWAAGQRFLNYIKGGQRVVILHLGDHDPSGIDMTRDIEDRLRRFVFVDWARDHLHELGKAPSVPGLIRSMTERLWDPYDRAPLDIHRIALNMDQVEQYNPPPNPAKLTDSRAESYIEEHGYESWELDALDPATLDALIREHVEGLRDDDVYERAVDREAAERETLRAIAEQYDDVAEQFGEAR